VRITNVYNRTVINNVTINRASFNGPGGVRRAPTRTELAIAREPHFMPSPDQVRQRERASHEAALRASVNHGAPAIAATERPGLFDRGVMRAQAAATTSREEKIATMREAAGTRTTADARTAAHDRTAPTERAQRATSRADARDRLASEREHFKQQRESIRENAQAQHRALIAEHVRSVHEHAGGTARDREQAAAERAQFKQRREAIRETAQSERRAAVAEHVQAMQRNREAVSERSRFEARGPQRTFENRPEPRAMMRNAAPDRGDRRERPKDQGPRH